VLSTDFSTSIKALWPSPPQEKEYSSQGSPHFFPPTTQNQQDIDITIKEAALRDSFHD